MDKVRLFLGVLGISRTDVVEDHGHPLGKLPTQRISKRKWPAHDGRGRVEFTRQLELGCYLQTSSAAHKQPPCFTF